ncbi:MAG: phosphoribosylanthranilate isomerase, partial [Acidobacteriota bacterium]
PAQAGRGTVLVSRITVKVCGITRLEDARKSIELGADLLGFNFWPGSPRYIEPEVAQPMLKQLKGKAILVGVWVDPAPAEVRAALASESVELAQLHGNEDPSTMQPFMSRVLKAFQIDANFAPERLEPWKEAWGYLYDCAPSGTYGGSGRAWPYERVAGLKTYKPELLAGGISEANLAEALERSGASIVDLCSSVEAAPGIKDFELLESFFREVENVQENARD